MGSLKSVFKKVKLGKSSQTVPGPRLRGFKLSLTRQTLGRKLGRVCVKQQTGVSTARLGPAGSVDKQVRCFW